MQRQHAMAETPDGQRKQGVTPGMSHRYETRTAQRFAGFVLPHLKPGMRLLDVGCGPGSITLGLAEAVAPGQVIGIDHDPEHIKTAQRLATERGLQNVSFEVGSVYDLSFPDNTFDAVFEHAVFIHLPDPVAAARGIFRVIKPGGLFAARDTAMDGHLLGNAAPLLEQSYEIHAKWQSHRGSNMKIGRHLRRVLREAGFAHILGSATYDTYGSEPDDVYEHGTTWAGMLSGSLGDIAVEQGWADKETLGAMSDRWLAWRDHPDSFVANAMGEAIGWKPKK